MSQQPVVDRFLEAVRLARIDECDDVWAHGATLDATVPNWRFHRAGSEQIRATHRGWFADPGRFEELRRWPASLLAEMAAADA